MVRKAEHSGTSLAPSNKGKGIHYGIPSCSSMSRDVCFVVTIWDLLPYLSVEQGARGGLGGKKKQTGVAIKGKQVTEIGELPQRTPLKSESLMMSIE